MQYKSHNKELLTVKAKVKVKQAWTDREVSRRFSLPNFKTVGK